MSTYKSLDTNLPKSIHTLYYRLRQVDTDGAFAYSQIVSVRVTANRTNMTLAPNPTTGELNLTLDTAAPNTMVEVYDLTGRLVRSFVLGEQTHRTLNLTSLEAGLYLLRVGTETQRFVKR